MVINPCRELEVTCNADGTKVVFFLMNIFTAVKFTCKYIPNNPTEYSARRSVRSSLERSNQTDSNSTCLRRARRHNEGWDSILKTDFQPTSLELGIDFKKGIGIQMLSWFPNMSFIIFFPSDDFSGIRDQETLNQAQRHFLIPLFNCTVNSTGSVSVTGASISLALQPQVTSPWLAILNVFAIDTGSTPWWLAVLPDQMLKHAVLQFQAKTFPNSYKTTNAHTRHRPRNHCCMLLWDSFLTKKHLQELHLLIELLIFWGSH